MALKNNTWKLNQWYDQDVAGNVSYSATDSASFYSWGRSYNGMLGVNFGGPSNDALSSPTQIPGTTWNTDPRHCVANSYAFAHAKTDGTLWAWGLNWGGGLGQNNRTNYSSPVQVGSDTTWAAGQTNSNNSFGIKTDGTLWVWGRNTLFTMGNNQPSDWSGSSPVQIGSDATWSSDYGKYELAGSCAQAIKTDGTLWGWGTNDYGRLGLNNGTSQAVAEQVGSDTDWSQLTAGYQHSLFLKTDGTLWAAGGDAWGATGLNLEGNPGRRSSPTQIPGTTWKSVSAGNYHSAAIKTDGSLWTWGNGGTGRLGLNSTTEYSSPVQVPGTTWNKVTAGENSCIASKTDGTLWVWGANENGVLGQNNETHYSSPTQIPGTKWVYEMGSASKSFFVGQLP